MNPFCCKKCETNDSHPVMCMQPSCACHEPKEIPKVCPECFFEPSQFMTYKYTPHAPGCSKAPAEKDGACDVCGKTTKLMFSQTSIDKPRTFCMDCAPTPSESNWEEKFRKKFLEPDFYSAEDPENPRRVIHAERRFLSYAEPKEVMSFIRQLLSTQAEEVAEKVSKLEQIRCNEVLSTLSEEVGDKKETIAAGIVRKLEAHPPQRINDTMRHDYLSLRPDEIRALLNEAVEAAQEIINGK